MGRLTVSQDTIAQTKNLLNLEPIAKDLTYCLLGEPIGSGVYRSVFANQLNQKEVIKIEIPSDKLGNVFCNVQEYILWSEIKGLCGSLAWVKDWFAPVKWISPAGNILCMQRTCERPAKKKPTKIPKFLWDVKEANFGWIGNNYVCHDYGSVHAFIEYRKTLKDVSYAWQ